MTYRSPLGFGVALQHAGVALLKASIVLYDMLEVPARVYHYESQTKNDNKLTYLDEDISKVGEVLQ